MFAFKVGLEGQGTHDSDIGESLGEDVAGLSGEDVAFFFPFAADVGEKTGRGVHDRYTPDSNE